MSNYCSASFQQKKMIVDGVPSGVFRVERNCSAKNIKSENNENFWELEILPWALSPHN
jgi:hypothetical protein